MFICGVDKQKFLEPTLRINIIFMLTRQAFDQEIENLILMCRRQGSHYTAQKILGEIDELLKNIKYIPFTINLRKIREKIVNTDTKETNLKGIYKEILDILEKYKMFSTETLKLKKFIEALLKLES